MICDPITDYVAGVFSSTTRFSECLRARGHTIIFIAARSPHNRALDNYNGMALYKFRSFLLPKTERHFYLALPTLGEIKSVLQKERIDIVHTLLPTPAAIISIKSAKSLGIKVIVHSHAQPENLFLHVPKILGRSIMDRIYRWYLLWIYKHADALIYPSKFAEALFENLNKSIKHMVISNGVDTSVFKKADAGEFFEKYNLPQTSKNILFVGRLHPEKSIDTLIKAVPHILKRCSTARVFIVGPGHMKDALVQLTRHLGVENHVIFFGKVEEKDLVFIYNACDIFVLPSLAELEGMVVLEAMACGKPIVIADAPQSASRYFVEGNGFLFKPEDPKDLAEKLITLLNDDDMRRAMGEKSFQISKQYDINTSVEKLEELYYSLLS